MHVTSIAAFVAVARNGSVTEAAHDLRFSQPAVSRQIQALEVAVGTTLFERSGQQLVMTPTGRTLLPVAEAMLALSRAMTAHGDPPGTTRALGDRKADEITDGTRARPHDCPATPPVGRRRVGARRSTT